MEWSRLKYFYYVGKETSITEAAQKRNISQPALSRQIISLENQLGYALLERKKTGIKLTDKGQLLYNQAKKMAGSVKLALHEISEEKSKIRGPLKICTTPLLAKRWVFQYLESFQKAYPYVRIHLCTDKSKISGSNADVYILPHQDRATDYNQTHLISLTSMLYASPAYVEKFGMPKKLSDLHKHRFLSHNPNYGSTSLQSHWSLMVGLDKGQCRKAHLESDTLSFLIRAAEQGIGIIELPKGYPDSSTSNLINILPKVESPEIKIYFTVHEEKKDIARIRALLMHIEKVQNY